MSTNDELLKFIQEICYKYGENGKPIPTFKILAEEANKNGLTSIGSGIVTKSSVQYTVGDKETIREAWANGNIIYVKNTPSLSDDDKKENEERRKSVMSHLYKRMGKEELRKFCVKICMEVGQNGGSLPTLNDLADIANEYGYVTKRNNPVNHLSINAAIDLYDRRKAWEDGFRQNLNTDVFDPSLPRVILEDTGLLGIDIKTAVERFCHKEGMNGNKKPTLSQLTDFVNQNGYKTQLKKREYTTSTLFRHLNFIGVDIQNAWYKGVVYGKEITGKITDLDKAIIHCAFEWGYNNGNQSPNMQELSERLFSLNFQTDKGRRLSTSTISTCINEHQISIYQLWNKGHEKRKLDKILKEEEEPEFAVDVSETESLFSSPQNQPIQSTQHQPEQPEQPFSIHEDEQSEVITSEAWERWKKVSLKNVKNPSHHDTLIQTPYEALDWIGQGQPSEVHPAHFRIDTERGVPMPNDLRAWANPAFPTDEEILGETEE